MLDGLNVVLMENIWDSSYSLADWEPEDDKKVMIAIYCAEQFYFGSAYSNDFKKFEEDWASHNYHNDGALTIAAKDMDILEEFLL